MIGVDTNLLLRFLLRDEEEQYLAVRERLQRALDEREVVWIGPVTFTETVWTLARRLRVPPVEIAEITEVLLATPPLRIFDEPVVRRALTLYRTTPAGFSDCIIRAMDASAGCHATLSFDAKAKLPGFIHPAD